ncbi:hypothetical protein ACFU53_13105 [Streptomyces sp. NPDC057474]|uniref:hypothetical protein n=1 Tax=Streptomyces sp. NPDC057474 TaxID=3346144 RepID=UPI0036B54191
MDDLLSGIVFDETGDVYISGRSRCGRVPRRSATQGFSVLGRHDAPVIDMAHVDGRLFFAATKGGVIEWTPEGPKTLRDDITPRSIDEGEGRINVTETRGEAEYSELDLFGGRWQRRFH